MKSPSMSANIFANEAIKRWLQFFLAVGLIGFLAGLKGKPYSSWQGLLVNTLFFWGIASGGIAFSVIFTMTDCRWGKPFKRISEAMASFLPVGALLIFFMCFGIDHLFEWSDPDRVIPAKMGWLNLPLFVFRNVLGLAVFVGLAAFYLASVLKPDAVIAKNSELPDNFLMRFLVRNSGPQDQEIALAKTRAKRMAPIVGITFFLFSTLMAFDWMSSIDQTWHSTLFGTQYAVSNLMAGGAFLMLLGSVSREKLLIAKVMKPSMYKDLTRLTFAFCMVWSYLVFAQLLVIWYANLPEEASFFVMRLQFEEWAWLSWVILILLFVLPLIGLISTRVCDSVMACRLLATGILVGAWFEKYWIVAPSLHEYQLRIGILSPGGVGGSFPGLCDITLGLGLLGLFGLCFGWFLKSVPLVPLSDPLLSLKDSKATI